MVKLPFKSAERLSLGNLQSEITGLLEKVWHRGLSTGPLDGQDFAPPIELCEEPEQFVVTAELPGVSASTLEVSANIAGVTISGEKPKPVPPDSPEGSPPLCSSVIQSERRYGHFHRTVAIPSPIQVDQVSANLTDGILTVSLPKAPGSALADVRVEIRKTGEG